MMKIFSTALALMLTISNITYASSCTDKVINFLGLKRGGIVELTGISKFGGECTIEFDFDIDFENKVSVYKSTKYVEGKNNSIFNESAILPN